MKTRQSLLGECLSALSSSFAIIKAVHFWANAKCTSTCTKEQQNEDSQYHLYNEWPTLAL